MMLQVNVHWSVDSLSMAAAVRLAAPKPFFARISA